MEELNKIYDSEYVCSYWEHQEDEEMCDELFQLDFLSIFKLQEFDLTKINKCIFKLYETFKDNDDLKTILNAIFLNRKFHIEKDDYISCFMYLYSFDLLHATHPIMSFIINHSQISESELETIDEEEEEESKEQIQTKERLSMEYRAYFKSICDYIDTM